MNTVKNSTGFKLLSLELKDNSLTAGSHLQYTFTEDEDNQKSLYTTVIIGANGTGKSNLFRIIIELLKELNDLAQGKNRNYSIDGLFNLKYTIDNKIFEYTNIIYADGTFRYDGQPELDKQNPDKSNRAYLRIDGQRQDEFSTARLPISIVANSIMLTDKFPFFKKETDSSGEKVDGFPMYKYLGVRNIPQSASTRAYVRRTVEFIVNQFDRKNKNAHRFIAALKRATDFLELENSIDIFYFTSNNAKFFRGNLSPQVMEEYFEAIHQKYPKPEDNPPFKLNQYLRIKDDTKLLEAICDFCNKLHDDGRLEKSGQKYSSIKRITYNLIDGRMFELLNEDYAMLEHLRQLGMISAPEIQLRRKGGYSLQESSSGEYHFFSSVVGLMATVTSDSIILIDEPEISLHPNWQMKYMTFIRELFSGPEYASCHILVATHSHFLISDLKGTNSKIIGLRRVEGKVEIVDMPHDLDTFGWSAEDVLYTVFSVRTTRNHYMEVDLRNLLHSISEKSVDKNGLQTILNRLEAVRLNDDDPLNSIIAKAKEYIEKL